MTNKIRLIREARGMMQKELAQAAGISQPYLYDLERGARGARQETKERLAAALGCTIDDLFKEEEQDACKEDEVCPGG